MDAKNAMVRIYKIQFIYHAHDVKMVFICLKIKLWQTKYILNISLFVFRIAKQRTIDI